MRGQALLSAGAVHANLNNAHNSLRSASLLALGGPLDTGELVKQAMDLVGRAMALAARDIEQLQQGG